MARRNKLKEQQKAILGPKASLTVQRKLTKLEKLEESVKLSRSMVDELKAFKDVLGDDDHKRVVNNMPTEEVDLLLIVDDYRELGDPQIRFLPRHKQVLVAKDRWELLEIIDDLVDGVYPDVKSIHVAMDYYITYDFNGSQATMMIHDHLHGKFDVTLKGHSSDPNMKESVERLWDELTA